MRYIYGATAITMTYRKIFTPLLILACLTGLYSFTGFNGDPLQKITDQLEKWTIEQPVEKAYLQLDKPYYAAGDDIWFKAYVVTGANHRLSTLGSVLNVELIDDRDSITRSIKLPLYFGTASGDFALPDTLRPGTYHIRAYTNYMRNAGAAYFFNKAVTIINPVVTTPPPSKKQLLKPATGKPDVQFFPEGGYLVTGITSKVAFKAVGSNRLGAEVKGSVTDNTGKTVSSFNSTHLGMGIFEMTPVAGAIYQANVIFADGSTSTIALPAATDKGSVLTIDDSDPENLMVKIFISRQLLLDDTSRQFVLVGQSGGKIYYAAKSKPGLALFTSVIPKNKFPSGIAQFTLFANNGEPLNERLVFINRPDQLKLNVTADNNTYAPRQKVKINIDAKNSDDKPVVGSYSVAVTDETKVPVNEDNENNIFANLLLTSDLSGYVEQPAWYFNHTDENAHAALDVLMLTQGYRRFEWKKILNDDFPLLQYHPENSLQIAGTVLTPDGKPVVKGKVTLLDIDSARYSRDTVTDDRGRFLFKNMSFSDSVRFIIQARTDKNKNNVVIKLDRTAPEGISGTANFEVKSIEAQTVYAQNSKQLYNIQRKFGLGNHVIPLQEVIIREKRQALKNSSNLNGPGNANQVVSRKELEGLACVDIADCLQGKLLGVVFRGGIPYSTRGHGPMQVIVDGIYEDGNFLTTINSTDIQTIEVLRDISYTAIYGGRGSNGLIIITTRHGGDIDPATPIAGKGITPYNPKGYYKARVFYSPQYDDPKTNTQLADLRTTIFWKPDLFTGKDGKTFFEFFNAGSAGTYRVVVEGIDSEGHLGRQVYRYHVQ